MHFLTAHAHFAIVHFCVNDFLLSLLVRLTFIDMLFRSPSPAMFESHLTHRNFLSLFYFLLP